MWKEVNDDHITLALYFLFHAGWQRCATCHVKQNIMDANTGRELVIHWAEDSSTSFAALFSQRGDYPPPFSNPAMGTMWEGC